MGGVERYKVNGVNYTTYTTFRSPLTPDTDTRYTLQYNAEQCSTVQHSMLNSAVQYSTVQYGLQYSTEYIKKINQIISFENSTISVFIKSF